MLDHKKHAEASSVAHTQERGDTVVWSQRRHLPHDVWSLVLFMGALDEEGISVVGNTVKGEKSQKKRE